MLMKFSKFSEYLEKLEKISSRNEMTVVLSDLFKICEADEIQNTTYLLLGSLAPNFTGIVFQMADKLVIEALAKAYRVESKEILSRYREIGDLGGVSEHLATQKIKHITQELSVNEVFSKLMDLAQDAGDGSVERKTDKMADILGGIDPLSAKFITRITLGKLRLGFSDKTILDALSYSEFGNKSGKKELEYSYNILPDVGYLASRVKEVGIKKTVADISPKVGYPLLSMLAARLKSPVEMIKKMGKVFVEPKFDGLRIQIHYKRGSPTSHEASRGNTGFVKAFTRNLNETSWMFPELEDIDKYINCDEVILDSEAVGVDEERKTMANFQTTMTRRRKYDIGEISSKVSITFNVFDIMLKDGKGLVFLPYNERRKILSETLTSGKLLKVVDYEITENPQRINELMKRELSEGLEGIIVKKFDAAYIAGRTGFRWVKMKEKENQKAKLADTIDCVVMGYFIGKGKRTSFGIGGFLVGVNNDIGQSANLSAQAGNKGQRLKERDQILALTKIGTGLTDELFRELKRRLKDLEAKEKPKEYEQVAKSLVPDIWVKPSLIVEIAADEITKSDIASSGYSLRFPRLVKFRDDKNVVSSTTLKEIKTLFRLQNVHH
jgi:DNA ligase 1